MPAKEKIRKATFRKEAENRRKNNHQNTRWPDQNFPGKKVPQEAPCPCCSRAHPLHRCNLFKEKSHVQKNEFVKVNGLCYNCLKNNPVQQSGIAIKHVAKCCPSKFKCRIEGCGASHHTLLHIPNQQKKESETILLKRTVTCKPTLSIQPSGGF